MTQQCESEQLNLGTKNPDSQMQQHEHHARWAPTSYKWSYNPYKWPYNWVTGVITLLIEVITPLITYRGPTLWICCVILQLHCDAVMRVS